jgi:integrase
VGVGVKGKREARYIATGDEYRHFVDACASAEHGRFFTLAIHTGLRFSEIAGLTWEDMTLTGPRGSLRVRRTIMRVRGGWKWSDPKSENGVRRVVFPAETATELVEQRKAQLEQKLKAGPLWQDHNLVFSNRVGAPISYCTLYSHFHAVLKAAGLPKQITMHKLRHFYIKAGYKAGIDPKTISREVGHARPSFTLDHYGDVEDQMLETSCDKREALLKNKR